MEKRRISQRKRLTYLRTAVVNSFCTLMNMSNGVKESNSDEHFQFPSEDDGIDMMDDDFLDTEEAPLDMVIC
jgi:hypothetical protein